MQAGYFNPECTHSCIRSQLVLRYFLSHNNLYFGYTTLSSLEMQRQFLALALNNFLNVKKSTLKLNTCTLSPKKYVVATLIQYKQCCQLHVFWLILSKK